MNREPDVAEFISVLSERIRQRRRVLGLTQEQLAERAGLSANYIARIEIASRVPALSTLYEIATALKTDIAGLLSDEEIPRPPVVDQLEYTLYGLSKSEAAFVVRQARSTAAYIRRHRSGR